MELDERKVYEEEETTSNDTGTTLLTIGFILLLFSIFLLLFVGRDIRDGAWMFTGWMAVQLMISVVFIFIGYQKRLRAHKKDDA